MSAAAFCNVRKVIRMEAEIARLKQDLKVDREIRKELKKINSKEGSIAETIHQRTEWLQSAGYQIDETEYTEMFVSDLHRSLLWRLVLLGVIFGLVGIMFAREGISLITAAGGGVGTFAMSMSMRSVYRFLAFLGKVYEEEVSLKVSCRQPSKQASIDGIPGHVKT